MKKNVFLFVIGLLLACTINGFSQISVNGGGDITFKRTTYSGGIIVGKVDYSGYNIPSIYPNSPNAAGLGSADKYFHIGYIHHIFSSIYDTWPSDKRAKDNIRILSGTLDKVLLLNPVKYDISDEFISNLSSEAKKEYEKNSKDRLGFIAQEVQEIFPELVNEEPITGYLGINTVDLIPVLIQAIKEQQKQIEELKQHIEKIEQTSK